MEKHFAFGQRVKYDGCNEPSLITGKAITDPTGNVADGWWWLATPNLPSILTHANNIEPIDDEGIEYSYTHAVGSPVIVRNAWPALVQSYPGIGDGTMFFWWVRPMSGHRLIRVREHEIRPVTSDDITCSGSPIDTDKP